MKLSELKPCASCHGKLVPIWYVIRVSQAMLKPKAANQVLGMTQMLRGRLDLAESIAPDSECVLVMGDEEPALMTEIPVCQDCFLLGKLKLPMLMESVNAGKSV